MVLIITIIIVFVFVYLSENVFLSIIIAAIYCARTTQ